MDIVGFSRGAALALAFANKVCDQESAVRFLGLWDTVPSFGIAAIPINIGWDLDLPHDVAKCFHAMALDERRIDFKLHRPDAKVEDADQPGRLFEVWFRGVHSDVGGGNDCPGLSSIALNWMFAHAAALGLPIDPATVTLNAGRMILDTPISVHGFGKVEGRDRTVAGTTWRTARVAFRASSPDTHYNNPPDNVMLVDDSGAEAGRFVRSVRPGRHRREVDGIDAIFQPLQFRNLTIKNRILRSNVSGRFDNYDGSGNQARINWEAKFARGGVGAIVSSFVPVHLRGRIVPNYAMIDDDRHIPFWRALGQGGARVRLQVHHAAQSRRPPARHQRHRVSRSASAPPTRPIRPHGFRCERMTIAADQGDGAAFAEGRAARARGRARRRRAARRERLPDHAVPQLGDQRPQGRIRRLAREPRAVRARHRPRDPRARRQRLPPADEDQRAGSQRRASRSSARGRRATRVEESVQVCQWLVEAGVDAIHVSIGSFFPHPRNPAGVDLPVEVLADTYDALISSGEHAFRTYLLFRNLPDLARRQWNDAAPPADEIEGQNLADARRVKQAVAVPVICTGGFQTASVIAGALERGDCDAVSIARPLDRQQRPGRSVSPRPGPRRSPVHLLQQVPGQRRRRIRSGATRRSRFPSREAMLAEIMSVFHPPPFV